MTVSSNALSLVEWAALSNEPLVKAVTYSLRDNGSLLADIPFVNKASLIVNGRRVTGGLPSVDWASLNDEGTTRKSTTTPYQEQLYMIREYVDVDVAELEDDNWIVDPRGFNTEMIVRAIAYDFNDKFINNNHTAGTVKAPVGIRARLDDNTNYGTRSDCKIDASGATADMSPSLTASTANKFFEKLDQLLWAVNANDGQGVMLLVNDTLKRRMATAARLMGTTGGFRTDQDQYGRTVEMYRGAVVRDIGYKADQSTAIITSTEDASGNNGSGNFTSMYAVKLSDSALFGWQQKPLSAQHMGLLDNAVTDRTLIEWRGGLIMQDTRSIARLYDIKIS